MKVIDFITNCTNLKKFYCQSDIAVCAVYQLYYKRKGKIIPKKKTEEVVHSAINLCHLSKWKEYASYKRFANREFVKIDGNMIYTHWTPTDIIREYIKLCGGKEYCKLIKENWITSTLPEGE